MKKQFIIILFLITNSLLAQVKFEAVVSKNALGINERLRIDFSMNEDGDNFAPPNFESCGFRVVGGPSQSISQSWINGKSSFNKAYSYILMPLQKGNLVIKQATIEINGQVYKTLPVKITIGNAVAQQQQQQQQDPYGQQGYGYPQYPQQQQQQQQQPTYAGKDGVQLIAEISNTNPYLNEPITVVYKIYVSSRSSVRGWEELDKPKYADFWSQNIDIKQLVVQQAKFKGENYRYAILRKTVLYPQKAGKLEIEPLSLNVQVEIPTGDYDVFGRPEMTVGIKKVSAGAKIITVKPLPEAGKPVDFSGAVGRFDFKVTPSRTNLKSGESLDLNVVVSGTGNLKLFSLPKPVVPASLEMYDPEHSENVTTPLSGMTGSINDKYAIIPQYKGNYPIKPMQFSYFDLGSKSYKTITSPEIMINVLEGAGIPNPTAVAGSKVKVASSKAFAFIKQKTTLLEIKQDDFLSSGLFYTLFFLPFLIIPAIVLFKKKKEALDADVIGNRRKKSNALAKKYLSEAKKQINNKEPFYVALEKSLHNFLKAKLHIETSEMSKDKISELLLSRKANPETVTNFITLTENCELARYAQSSSVAIQQDYDKAVALILELEKQIV